MRELNKGAMFPKDNIATDTKTMRDRIITLIPLLSFAIAKKTIKPRSGSSLDITKFSFGSTILLKGT